MKLNRLYNEFAHLYPLISSPEAYTAEAKLWKRILREKLGPGRHSLIEMGVGGGFNLSHFVDEYECTGSDLSEKMVINSLRLNPTVPHVVADMRTMRLGRTFDAYLIHDAICYMQTEDDLKQTFATAMMHLKPGGVFITTPDYYKETFVDGMVRHNTLTDGKTTLTHLEYEYDLDASDTTNQMLIFYLIRQGGKLRVEKDLHVFGLFPTETWLRLMNEAGFEAERRLHGGYEDGREGYFMIGVKPN